MWFIMVIAISEPVYHLCCLGAAGQPLNCTNEGALVNLFNHLWKLIIFLLEHISIRKLQTLFFIWFEVVWVGCCKIICCWALVFCCRKLAICQFLAILFFSPLYCSWYGNRPLSQGWCKPCRVAEADLSHGTSLACSCSANTPRCIYSMEWNRENTISCHPSSSSSSL